MKKSLYEILGVDPKASKEEIEAAYIARIDELKFATVQDPNKLRVLQQSKEILTDPNQRSTYDASLSRPEPPARRSIPAPPPEPSFMQQWGKWAGIAIIAIALVVWGVRRREPPPPPEVAKPVPIKKAEPVAQAKPAGESAPTSAPVAPVTQEQPVADASARPVLGDWNCTDAISGRASKYSFREGGVLAVASTDGLAEYKFEMAGRTLTISETSKVSTWTAEELTQKKMILNTGADGRRIVCKR